MLMKTSVDNDVQLLWSYMLMGRTPTDADLLMVLGSRDDRVARYAAELAKRYRYGRVLISGGIAHGHDLLKTAWAEETEAAHFLSVMWDTGYKGEVLLEHRAQNTGQNATYSYALLVESGEDMPRSVLIVTKPYMERRALATFEAQWPDDRVMFSVHAPLRSIDDYCNDDQPYEDVVNIMVGDFQRIMEYPKQGFQREQHVPAEVLGAWKRLVEAGYTKHLISK